MKTAMPVVVGGGILTAALVASPVQAAEVAIPQRIVVDPVAVQNWDADVTVSGQVQQDRGAGWVAAPAGLVVHFDSPDGQLQVMATVQTGGRFSATFYPGPGNIIARVPGYGQVTETSARVLGWISRLYIDQALGDRETNPVYPLRGKTFQVRRTLKAVRGEALPGRKVTLWWAPKGASGYPKTGWKQVSSGVTDAQGRVKIGATAWTAGWLRTSYSGDATYTGVDSGYPFRVYYKTGIAGFNASPEPARKGQYLTLKGRLMRWTSSGGWQPIKGKWVSAKYRLKGQTTLRTPSCTNGGDATSSTGWFQMKCKTPADATWMAYYLSPYASPDTSKTDFPAQATDYVDVR
ncbi:hypothetical protein [Actinomadura latina]|uniref:Carboxypeptidase regulatory-like domain-containing protein n=1 Tax=Actinomadura latina TaxID=163603 RepID=A0A846Z7W8_9ACTN|nr:hypothetical protein [Actinomadura latina]NKZ07887.1 hypothetical protein [Actinomadura latina]